MSIGSYPRVTVQGTGKANNTQNGLGLMLFNSTTQQYEAATAATFAGGGGGGGDATAANQTTQITEAQSTNTYLSDIQLNTTGVATAANQTTQITEAQSTNTYLSDIQLNTTGVATAANQTTQITEVQTTNSTLDGINTTLLDNVSGGNTLTDLLNQLIAINGGVNGSVLVSNGEGTLTGLSVKKIVVNEDAVLNILTDTSGANLLTTYNLSGRTLKQGAVLVTRGSNINSIRVASGSVLIYGA